MYVSMMTSYQWLDKKFLVVCKV